MDDTASSREAEHEAGRLRGPKRLVLVGPGVALLLAMGSGVLGADGAVGLFVFLLLLAATFGSAGLWIGIGLLLDEFRGSPTSLRRGVLTAGLFAATLVCMTAIGGVAATLEAGS